MAHIYHYVDMRSARLLQGCAVLLLAADVLLVPAFWTLGGSWLAAIFGLVLLTLLVCAAAAGHGDEAGWWFEMTLRRKFRAVCREKGLTTKDDQGRVSYPALTQIIGNKESFLAVVRPLHGQSVADWDGAAGAFTLSLAVVGLRVDDRGDGTLSFRAGHQSLDPQVMTVEEEWPEVGQTWREKLRSVRVGITSGAAVYALPVIDSHVLVAGKTGAGKGSVIWSMILGLYPGYKAGVVKFWGLDPKRMELSIGREFFADRYACSEEDMVALLERAAEEMLQRAESLGGRLRKFDPSPDCPLNVIIVDELAYISSLLTERALEKRAEKALKALLALGRSAGFVVVGALQDPRKETISFRDLFPTKVGMWLDKPMVDLVFGHGAHEAGALCDLIPPPTAGGSGVAFVIDEASGKPVHVRFNWCPDDLIQETAGKLPPGEPVLQIA